MAALTDKIYGKLLLWVNAVQRANELDYVFLAVLVLTALGLNLCCKVAWYRSSRRACRNATNGLKTCDALSHRGGTCSPLSTVAASSASWPTFCIFFPVRQLQAAITTINCKVIKGEPRFTS